MLGLSWTMAEGSAIPWGRLAGNKRHMLGQRGAVSGHMGESETGGWEAEAEPVSPLDARLNTKRAGQPREIGLRRARKV